MVIATSFAMRSLCGAERHFAQRMFRYFAALSLKYTEPVYPVAVFSYDAPARPEPGSYSLHLPGLDVLQFNFECVQLNRLSWRTFMKMPNPVAAALMARMPMSAEERPRVKAVCLRMLAGLKLDLASSQVVARFVDAYLRLDEQEETMFHEEIKSMPDGEKVMEYITSWEERGIARGREEGIAHGREEGIAHGRETEALRIVGGQLRRRLGSLPAGLEERIAALDVAGLEALGEALLEMTSPADLVAWLDRSR
jgi:hypothetical protein